MSAQKGRDLLLKVADERGGAFTSLAGLRTRTFTLNARPVDITSADSDGMWRELLAGAGARAARLSGAGIFLDNETDQLARTLFFNGEIRDWRIIVPDFGTMEGPFQITGLEYAGDYDGEITWQITLESAGILVFTQA